MTVQSIRDRFLARTEQIRVRVPIDHDVVEDLDAALAERARQVTDYETAMKAYGTPDAKRSIADTPPVEPDLTDVDRWIEQADQKVDENSIVVTMAWRPKLYAELLRTSVLEKWTSLQLSAGIAKIYYLRSEGLIDGEWIDLDLTWDDLEARLSEGEVNALAEVGSSMANAGDATPFKKRGKTSAPS